MEEHVLDIGKRLWSTSRYGLTAIGTWARIDGRWRPCMAILRDGHPQFKPCVISIDVAWQWSDLTGDPYPRAVRMLPHLGVDPSNQENVHKLISLVNSRIRDLIVMPPRSLDAEEHATPVVDLMIDNEITGKTEVSL